MQRYLKNIHSESVAFMALLSLGQSNLVEFKKKNLWQ